MVKSIYLQDGEEIFVDDEDYERVNQYTWMKVYRKKTSKVVQNSESVSLPSFINGKKESYQIKKNNYFTKSNIAHGHPNRYTRAKSNNPTIYKGVRIRDGKYCAEISVDGKKINLGRFDNLDDAAKSYNNGIDEYWDGLGYKNIIGIDNRIKKSNYRTYKNQQNKRNKTSYKGLVYKKDGEGYAIQIKNTHVGYSKSKHIAALMYNKCSTYLYDNDAILNEVPMTDELKEFISNWEIPDKIKALKEGEKDGNI
ncbi:AP2 domain-containing protein [Staphylococcus xylosus]|uniref:AP2 domain-containing protein n=1 Tax=Staphylococcus xylosus TaxID=1288 RepID=UPI003CF2CC43